MESLITTVCTLKESENAVESIQSLAIGSTCPHTQQQNG